MIPKIRLRADLARMAHELRRPRGVHVI